METPRREGSPRPERIVRALRAIRVGLCFLYFGVGVWLATRVLLPILRRTRWRGLSPEDVTLRTQRVVHLFCRSFIACISRVMRVGQVQWIGAEALLNGPVLVVANHPSLIDTPLLLTKLPQADFIVSPDWLRFGLLRPVVESAGYLRVEDGAAVVRHAAERLRAGHSVVVYPEGSRTPAEGLRAFQRGAAHIALRAGCDIVPVCITVTPRALMQGQGWTDFPLENPVFRIEVGEPIRPAVAGGEEKRTLAARRLTGVLEEHFQKRWTRGGS
ncbi:MAG: lysophospholipid acyltransferase family protein [Myxococcota bacterium]